MFDSTSASQSVEMPSPTLLLGVEKRLVSFNISGIRKPLSAWEYIVIKQRIDDSKFKVVLRPEKYHPNSYRCNRSDDFLQGNSCFKLQTWF